MTMPNDVDQPASALRVIADKRHEDHRTLIEELKRSVSSEIPPPEELSSIDDLLMAQSKRRPAVTIQLLPV